MPELPEVETIARQLHAGLAGHVFGRVRLLRPDIVRTSPPAFIVGLTGRRIAEIYRRAKQLRFRLDPLAELIFHLGMSGRMEWTNASAPLSAHTHLRIGVRGQAREIRFVDPRRFGGVWFVPEGEKATGRGMGRLGPEPLTLRLPEFRKLLDHRAKIKCLLLDQRRIAGIGNIYGCEALYRAGIHPLTPARDIDPVNSQRLLRAIKTILRRAILWQGSTYMDYRTVDGEPGSFQRFHRVYQRENQPCRTCRMPIERLMTGGRSTFFCPRCQSLPISR